MTRFRPKMSAKEKIKLERKSKDIFIPSEFSFINPLGLNPKKRDEKIANIFQRLNILKEHLKNYPVKEFKEKAFRIIFFALLKEYEEYRPNKNEVEDIFDNIFKSEESLEKAYEKALSPPIKRKKKMSSDMKEIYFQNTGEDLVQEYQKLAIRRLERKIVEKQKKIWIHSVEAINGKYIKNKKLIDKSENKHINHKDMPIRIIQALGNYYKWLTGKDASQQWRKNKNKYEGDFLEFAKPIWKTLYDIVWEEALVENTKNRKPSLTSHIRKWKKNYKFTELAIIEILEKSKTFQ